MKSKTLRTLFAAAVITVAASSIAGCYYYDYDHWRRPYGYYGDRYGYYYGYRYDRDDYYRRGYDRDDYWWRRYSRNDRDHDHDND